MTQLLVEAAQQSNGPSVDKDAIRPFRVNFPEAELAKLRRRINATKWPERETVADDSQGVPLATMRELANYWASGYDWRKVEARLNAVPQFINYSKGVHNETTRGQIAA